MEVAIRWFDSPSSPAPPAYLSQAFGRADRMMVAELLFSVFAFSDLFAHAIWKSSIVQIRFDGPSYSVVRFAMLASTTGLSLSSPRLG